MGEVVEEIVQTSKSEIESDINALNQKDVEIEAEDELCDLMDAARVTSPSSSEDSLRKNRNDSGSSFLDDISAVSKKISGSGNSTDSGHGSNGSTEAEEGVTYAYHFLIPGHLCGVLIGARGANVKQLREATKCDVSLEPTTFEERPSNRKAKKDSSEPQICIIEGTRNGIERCLELIQERLPTHMYPDFTIKQINEPTAADLLQSQARQGLSVTLPPGQLTGATITAIVSTAHIFLQLPDSLTFHHLRRLQHCMRCTYERLSDSLPKVPKEAVETGLVCVMKAEDRYYRLQVVNYDISSDCCEVKFLDFGGYETVDVSDLLQIRQDFMNLPFQAVECYLSNVIPPASGTEWPYESIILLEEMTRGKTISCREIGLTEDSIPIVQLYITSFNDIKDELETRFVNKELVDRGHAQWIEHSVVS